jgi:hypothetical protein
MTPEREASDETGRLMRAISALSAAPELVGSAGRRLVAKPAAARDLLEAILAEVNETVLRRHLTFVREGSSMLKLDVKERRIVKIVTLEQACESASRDCVGRSLTQEDGQKILQVLVAFCEAAGPLTVRSFLPEIEDPDVYGGVSCSDLEACLDQQDPKPALQPDILAVQELTRQYAVAMVCLERDNVIRRSGSHMRCDSLERLLPALQESTANSQVRLWPEGLCDNLALLTARQQELLVVALVPRANAEVCFAHWHDVIINAYL